MVPFDISHIPMLVKVFSVVFMVAMIPVSFAMLLVLLSWCIFGFNA